MRTLCSPRVAAEREEKHCWGSLGSWSCNQVTSLLAAYKSDRGSLQYALMWGGVRNMGGRGRLKWAHTHKSEKGKSLIMKCVRPLHSKVWLSHSTWQQCWIVYYFLQLFSHCILLPDPYILKSLNTEDYKPLGRDGNKFLLMSAASRHGVRMRRNYLKIGLLRGWGRWKVLVSASCVHVKGVGLARGDIWLHLLF